MTIRWYGLVAPEEAATGDRRMFASNGLTGRDFPLPAAWQRVSGSGHSGSVVVASWDRRYPGDGGVWGAGQFLDPGIVPEVTEAIYLLEKGLIGPSVDLDPDFAYEVVPHPDRPDEFAMKVTRGNVHGVTFVMGPAFPQVHITVDTEQEMTILASAGVTSATFATSGVNTSAWRKLPLAPRETKFDFETAITNVAAWSGGDASKFGQAFLWKDPQGNPANRETYRLPIADVIDGKLYLIPRAVFSAGVIMSGGHGGLYDTLDEGERIKVQEVITDIYDMLRDTYADPRVTAPWQKGGRQGARSEVDEPARVASLRSNSDMDGDSIMTWAQNAVVNYVKTAGNISTGEAPGLGGSVDPASTGVSELACHCQTSSATIALPLSNHDVDSATKFVALAVRTQETSSFATNDLGGDIKTTPLIASATMQPQQIQGEPLGGDSVNEPPTGEPSSTSPNSSGNTSQPFTSSSMVDASFVANLSNSDLENWARFGLHTSTTVTTPDEFADSCAPPVIEDSGPFSTAPNSSNGLPGTFATEPVGSTFPRLTSLIAAGQGVGPLKPPSAWFQNPNLKKATPLVVTEDGRVFGTLASWRQCHMGVGNKCVMAPQSRTNYQFFKQGSVLTRDGRQVRVGKITLGTGHADKAYGVIPAVEHYDDTGTCVAVVNAGEDSFGVWVAGALVDTVDESQVAALRRSPLSGDWRRVDGNLELVAALAVNSPGFPVLHEDEGGQYSLVAAGVLTEPDSPIGQPVAPAEITDPTSRFAEVDAYLAQAARADRATLIESAFQDLLPPQEGCGCGV